MGKIAGNKEKMRKRRGETFHLLELWIAFTVHCTLCRFWNEPTAYTPESRTEVHQYMAEKRKEGTTSQE